MIAMISTMKGSWETQQNSEKYSVLKCWSSRKASLARVKQESR